MIEVDVGRPIRLLDALYSVAVVHALVQRRDGEDTSTNLYTTVIYVGERDTRNVPVAGDESPISAEYGFYLLRQRMDRAEAAAFVVAATGGRATVAECEVEYDVEEPQFIFRAESSINLDPNPSLLGISTWGRERSARHKALDGVQLTKRTIAEITRKLSSCAVNRAAAAPLYRNPEKLGDLDEFWPSPVSCVERQESNVTKLDVEWTVDVPPSEADVRTRVSMHRAGALMATVEAVGVGSHTLDVLADSDEAEVCIDGVLVHRVGGWFVKSIGIAMGLDDAGEIELIGQRQTFKLHVSPRTVLHSSVGDNLAPYNRHAMQVLGKSWREAADGLDDVERLYDPRVPNPVQAALASLQQFGRHEVSREIRIVDPFILDAEALKAIAAIASGHEGGTTITVLTELKEPSRQNSGSENLTQGKDVAERENRRKAAEARFRTVADSVAKALGVRIIVRLAEGVSLHDRFLIVGTRVWHVGHSFNALGSSLSMIVESRVPLARAQLMAVLDPLFEHGKVVINVP